MTKVVNSDFLKSDTLDESEKEDKLVKFLKKSIADSKKNSDYLEQNNISSKKKAGYFHKIESDVENFQEILVDKTNSRRLMLRKGGCVTPAIVEGEPSVHAGHHMQSVEVIKDLTNTSTTDVKCLGSNSTYSPGHTVSTLKKDTSKYEEEVDLRADYNNFIARFLKKDKTTDFQELPNVPSTMTLNVGNVSKTDACNKNLDTNRLLQPNKESYSGNIELAIPNEITKKFQQNGEEFHLIQTELLQFKINHEKTTTWLDNKLCFDYAEEVEEGEDEDILEFDNVVPVEGKTLKKETDVNILQCSTNLEPLKGDIQNEAQLRHSDSNGNVMKETEDQAKIDSLSMQKTFGNDEIISYKLTEEPMKGQVGTNLTEETMKDQVGTYVTDETMKGQIGTNFREETMKGQVCTNVTEETMKGQVGTNVTEETMKGQVGTNLTEETMKDQVGTNVTEETMKGQVGTNLTEETMKGQVGTNLTEETMKGQVGTNVIEETMKDQVGTNVTEETMKGQVGTNLTEETMKGQVGTNVIEETMKDQVGTNVTEETTKGQVGTNVIEETMKDQVGTNVTEETIKGQVGTNVTEKTMKGQVGTNVIEETMKDQVGTNVTEETMKDQVGTNVTEETMKGQVCTNVTEGTMKRQVGTNLTEETMKGQVCTNVIEETMEGTDANEFIDSKFIVETTERHIGSNLGELVAFEKSINLHEIAIEKSEHELKQELEAIASEKLIYQQLVTAEIKNIEVKAKCVDIATNSIIENYAVNQNDSDSNLLCADTLSHEKSNIERRNPKEGQKGEVQEIGIFLSNSFDLLNEVMVVFQNKKGISSQDSDGDSLQSNTIDKNNEETVIGDILSIDANDITDDTVQQDLLCIDESTEVELVDLEQNIFRRIHTKLIYENIEVEESEVWLLEKRIEQIGCFGILGRRKLTAQLRYHKNRLQMFEGVARSF